MSQLEFDDEMASRIEALYRIGDAVRRRRIVREALGVAHTTVEDWCVAFSNELGNTTPASRQHFDVWQFAPTDKEGGGQQSYIDDHLRSRSRFPTPNLAASPASCHPCTGHSGSTAGSGRRPRRMIGWHVQVAVGCTG